MRFKPTAHLGTSGAGGAGVSTGERPIAAPRSTPTRFGDGFAVIILPAYLTEIGFDSFEIGIIATAALLGTALTTLAAGILRQFSDQPAMKRCHELGQHHQTDTSVQSIECTLHPGTVAHMRLRYLQAQRRSGFRGSPQLARHSR